MAQLWTTADAFDSNFSHRESSIKQYFWVVSIIQELKMKFKGLTVCKSLNLSIWNDKGATIPV